MPWKKEWKLFYKESWNGVVTGCKTILLLIKSPINIYLMNKLSNLFFKNSSLKMVTFYRFQSENCSIERNEGHEME
jgi:hypothetical protein